MTEFAIFPSLCLSATVFAGLKVLKLKISPKNNLLLAVIVSAIISFMLTVFAGKLFLFTFLYYAHFVCVPLMITSLTYLSLGLFPNFLKSQLNLKALVLGSIFTLITIGLSAISFFFAIMTNPMDPLIN